MTRIAVLDDYQDVALALADWSAVLQRAEIEIFRDTIADPDALVQRLLPFDIIVAMRERTGFPRAVLERLPNLKLIATTGMRNAAIDMAAAAERGITVCGTQGLAYPTVELTWALILALSRRIPHEDQNMRQGRGQTTPRTRLHRKGLGGLGLGRLGAAGAKIARA